MNRMINFSSFTVINYIFTGVSPPFATHLAEEGSKGKIFILSPTIEWMVVALSTL